MDALGSRALAIARALDRDSLGPVTLHPYGFYIVATKEAVDEIPIRFHVWVEGLRRAQEPVWPPHCHRSTMTSHVLSGALTNVTWPRPLLGFGQPLYHTEIAEGRSYLHRTPVELTLGSPIAERVEAGSSYVVPKGIFHDTQVPLEASCVTLCLFHADRSGKSLVAGAVDAPAVVEANRLALGEDEARRALALCCRALDTLTIGKRKRGVRRSA
ncbi:MAG: hypothetical protein NW216_13885 [Hyphomicrobium sp.]|nr:hypothetical protein [Hyphomicrobium sp.]